MTRIPVGVQLYSVRDDCARDLPGTLAAIQKMGYAGVEFAGYHGYKAADLRRMLDDLGLRCCGAHIGLDQMLGDALAETAEFHLTLGNRYLIVPWIAEERRNSGSAWLATADLFNQIAERLKPYHLLTGYHNHMEEFKMIEGQTGFDLFYTHTAAPVVLQFDIGNAMHGGADPMACLERYPGRSVTIHLKEFSATNPVALVGQGDVPWQEIFKFCEGQGGTEWYIVEQESYAGSPIDSIAGCLENLRRMGKV
jgi:sugar phosphate isomerase/epimerase